MVLVMVLLSLCFILDAHDDISVSSFTVHWLPKLASYVKKNRGDNGPGLGGTEVDATFVDFRFALLPKCCIVTTCFTNIAANYGTVLYYGNVVSWFVALCWMYISARHFVWNRYKDQLLICEQFRVIVTFGVAFVGDTARLKPKVFARKP
eukprot:1120230-Amphidinium_carterae.1